MRFAIQILKSIELSKAAQKRIHKCESEGLCQACLEPFDGTRVIRGTHERCYRATMRAISAGETTEEARVAEGKLAPRETAGRKPSNFVTIEVRGLAT